MDNTDHIASVKRRYHSLRDQGRCTRCPDPAIPGQSYCAKCAALNRQRRRDIMEQRRAAGRCLDCDTPVSGFARCERHRAAQAQIRSRSRQANRSSTDA